LPRCRPLLGRSVRRAPRRISARTGAVFRVPGLPREKTGARMSHYLVETFVPSGQLLMKVRPRLSPGGSYEIACSRTAALAKADRGHSMSDCRLADRSSPGW